MAMTNAERQARYREAGRTARAELDELEDQKNRIVICMARAVNWMQNAGGLDVQGVVGITGLSEEVIEILRELDDPGAARY